MIAAQAAMADFPLVPATRFATPEGYFAAAHDEAAAAPPAAQPAIWVGELYLEYHRGVLTSQGRTKRLNRRAERDLVGAEGLAGPLAVLRGSPPAPPGALWRAPTFHQCHDTP